MKKLATIIDYNVGNILNVARAFKFVGCEVKIAENPSEIPDSTDLLVLPGVGAFSSGMAELQKRGFVQHLLNYQNQNRPLMGICLGMQMLFEQSSEMGETAGLGLLPGEIRRIPSQTIDGNRYPVPHVGWQKMQFQNSRLSLNEGAVYFVHSYYVARMQPAHIESSVKYGQVEIPAIVSHGTTVGFQFHPEKSGEYGLSLLRHYTESLG